MKEPVMAYHFTNGWRLRDGQKLVVGKEYVFDGEPVMCVCGLHASQHVFDALYYAPGGVLSRVECREIADTQKDKLVCGWRKPVQIIDATDLLWKYARLCALDVIHLWDAQDVVVRYLKTGDDGLRASASASARDAAWDAASASAWDAALASALASAWDAARDAAWDAAWDAARYAARYAASASAWDAALASASASARYAAWDAARYAMIQKQRKRLSRMVREAFRETRP